MKAFMDNNFLLETKTAEYLYHEHASKMPLIDYHCHLIPQQIGDDIQFENLTQAWLYGDHYKWRALRSNGIQEKFITGEASDYEKFERWAETVPMTLRNPLYHWTHLELRRYFGIEDILNPSSARKIYDMSSEMLKTKEFSARGLMERMNVKVVCTTDDPIDNLEYHKKIAKEGFSVKVLPAWRPDNALAIDDISAFNAYIDRLTEASGVTISSFQHLLDALRNRQEYFHSLGCRLSDHGLENFFIEPYTNKEIDSIFSRIRSRKEVSAVDSLKFKSAMLYESAIMEQDKGWTIQFHVGPMRNNNMRMLKKIGPNTGFDSIGDYPIALPMSRFLDRLDSTNQLAKTILYNINPSDNEVVATMIGNFQDGSVAGKIQFGSGWWFLDQKDGMQRQLNTLSTLGLLSRFVGMLTDSRSLLSYPRHEYFRRILCNLLGNDVERGELPNDLKLLGQMVENISYNNAKEYFGFDI
jgi:glucuronate isomerase